MLKAIGHKVRKNDPSKWPMLVLRNDFAQQMQHKVCKQYFMR